MKTRNQESNYDVKERNAFNVTLVTKIETLLSDVKNGKRMLNRKDITEDFNFMLHTISTIVSIVRLQEI